MTEKYKNLVQTIHYICTISLEDDEAELGINKASKPDVILGGEDISALHTGLEMTIENHRDARHGPKDAFAFASELEGSVLRTELLYRK